VGSAQLLLTVGLAILVIYLVLDDFVEGAKRRLRRVLRRSDASAEAPATR